MRAFKIIATALAASLACAGHASASLLFASLNGGGNAGAFTDTFGGNGEVGSRFSIAASITVSALGAWDYGQDGFANGTVPVGIYDLTSHALVASATVSSSDPLGTNVNAGGAFRYVTITPVTLGAGSYAVVSYQPGDRMDFGVNPLVLGTGITYLGDTYAPAGNPAGLSFPTAAYGGIGNAFGANFQYDEGTSVPEPGTALLSLVGLGALAMLKRRDGQANSAR